MGAVYRPTDTKLDREVAIKVLPESFAQDRERLARFEREAKVLASLIWSFGVVLFECLTGQRLFTGETVTDSIGALLHKEIDWSQLPPNTPPGIQLLLRKCLARDRKRRLVESSFRSIKSLLETRPIFHKRDETIRGHVFCSYLATLLKRELERRLQEKGQSWEWAEIVRGLDNVHEVEARFQGKRFALRSQLQGQAGKAFAAAGVALPPS